MMNAFKDDDDELEEDLIILPFRPKGENDPPEALEAVAAAADDTSANAEPFDGEGFEPPPVRSGRVIALEASLYHDLDEADAKREEKRSQAAKSVAKALTSLSKLATKLLHSPKTLPLSARNRLLAKLAQLRAKGFDIRIVLEDHADELVDGADKARRMEG